MRRACAALSAVVLASCASSGGRIVPASSRPSPQPSPAWSTRPALGGMATAPAATRSTTVGSRLTLARPGEATVDVNALEVADPAAGSGAPPPGTRWVAVRVEVSNPAGPAYAESVYDAARLVDDRGAAYAPWRSEPVRPGFGGDFTLRQGAFKRGFVAFSVPRSRTAIAIRFTPAGGRGPDTGEWRLR